MTITNFQVANIRTVPSLSSTGIIGSSAIIFSRGCIRSSSSKKDTQTIPVASRICSRSRNRGVWSEIRNWILIVVVLAALPRSIRSSSSSTSSSSCSLQSFSSVHHCSKPSGTPTPSTIMNSLHPSTQNNITEEVSQPLQEQEQEQKQEERYRKLLIEEANYDPILHSQNKRSDYLSWDDYFLSIANLSAQRSKDPTTRRIGACIVDDNNCIVGIGYDGFPRGCSDDLLPWSRSSDYVSEEGGQKEKDQCRSMSWLHTKDPYICRAEVNAILNKSSADVKGARMYVPRIPCNECAKIIIQAGIKEIIYSNHPRSSKNGSAGTNHDDVSLRASRIMFQMAGVKLRHYTPQISHVQLDFGDSSSTTPTPSEKHRISTGLNTNDATTTNHQPMNSESYTTKNDNDDNETTERLRNLLITEAGYDPQLKQQHQYKRSNYLSWDDYFLAVAFLSAKRSKDPNTQVGACIVDANRCIVGIGYNGFPRGCSDDHLPWSRTSDPGGGALHTKYPYVVHAEVNAILNRGAKDVRGATLYVALFPCNDCAKVIVQSGIREVVYLRDVYHDTEACRASRILLEMSGVRYRRHVPASRILRIGLDCDDDDDNVVLDEGLGGDCDEPFGSCKK